MKGEIITPYGSNKLWLLACVTTVTGTAFYSARQERYTGTKGNATTGRATKTSSSTIGKAHQYALHIGFFQKILV